MAHPISDEHPIASPYYIYTTLYFTPQCHPVIHIQQSPTTDWQILIAHIHDLASFYSDLNVHLPDFGDFLGYDHPQITDLLNSAHELMVSPMLFMLFNALTRFQHPYQFLRAYNSYIQTYHFPHYSTYRQFVLNHNLPSYFYIDTLSSLLQLTKDIPHYGL